MYVCSCENLELCASVTCDCHSVIHLIIYYENHQVSHLPHSKSEGFMIRFAYSTGVQKTVLNTFGRSPPNHQYDYIKIVSINM